MENIETRELLGYTIEIIDIKDFKEYYDEHIECFNDFARNAFLKAISIPPAYFLEQPEETREELLCNKLDLVQVQKKYAGLSVVIISEGNQILNATKMKTNEVDARFEAISSIEDVEGIVWDRSLVKDGYKCGYLVCGTVSGKGQNRIISIDLPILFNKPTIIHEGFLELANPKMPVEKDMIYYTETEIVDYSDYQHIQLAVEAKLEEIDKTLQSIDDEDKRVILRESLDVLCTLIDEKVMPKSLLLPICRFLDNDEFDALTTKKLLKALISFDNNVKTLKHINALRGAKPIIDRLYWGEWCNEKESEDLDTE